MELKELSKLANHLDTKGLQKEADVLDAFMKEAGLLVDVAAWIAGKLSDETLSQIAATLPADRIAELAKKMGETDKAKQEKVIQLLAQDAEMREVALTALGIPPELAGGLSGAAGELFSEISGSTPAASEGLVDIGAGDAADEPGAFDLDSIFR